MPKTILSDNFFDNEATPFTFFKIPHQLISNPRFKCLSTDTKLLYGMLLDRMSLSAKNGWLGDAGRVYIYYTVKEVCESMGEARLCAC